MNYHQNKSYEAAISKFLQSLEIEPRNNRIRYFLGEAFYKAGYIEDAITQWDNIIKLGGQDSYLSQKINQIYYLIGQKRRNFFFTDYVYQKTLPVQSLENNVESYTVRFPADIYIDGNDVIHFLDSRLNVIGRIDGNGRFMGNLYGSFANVIPLINRLKNPVDFLVLDNKDFLVCDFGSDRLVLISKEGEKKKTIGSKGYKQNGDFPHFLGPAGITIDEIGNYFVTDVGNSRIHYINSSGEVLYQFGERGSDEGQLLMPTGILYLKKTKQLFVCDTGNNRIHIFDRTGKYLDSFGSSFLMKPRKIISHPTQPNIFIIVDRNDVYFYEINSKSYRSVFYNLNNVQQFKVTPISAAMDKASLLYVGDAHSGKIYQYSPIKFRYVNLIVRVENINVKNFPDILATVSVRNREGQYLSGLTRENFTLEENDQKVNNLKIIAESSLTDQLKLSFFIESSSKTKQMETDTIALFEDIYSYLRPHDQFELYAFGGGTQTGQDTYREIFQQSSLLSVLQDVKELEIYSDFYLGTGMKFLINRQLNGVKKKGIVLIVYSSYTQKQFLPEKMENIKYFAINNFIPISVIYLGNNQNQENRDLKDLCESTGGQYVIYNNTKNIENLILNLRNKKNGLYKIQYQSFRNEIKTGFFRAVSVEANYKGLYGLDNKAGYPIP